MVRRVSVLIALGALVALQLLAGVTAVKAAGPEIFTATLSGANEVPATTSAGTGTATLIVNPTGTAISYDVSYSGLSGPAVAAHIHLAATGVNGGILLPLKVGPSPMVGILTAADLTPTGGVTTFAGALDAIRAGNTYVNIHTAANPGGEIRGQVGVPAVSPKFILTADRPEAVPQGHNWAFDDFFPRTPTIASGDTFLFVNEGFHTFTLLPTSTTVAADNIANGVAHPDSDDTGLNKNGTKHGAFNLGLLAPVLPTPGCGSIAAPCAFDGSSVLSTAISFSGPTEPLAVKVTAPAGTYAFHCRVHPLMAGTLTVVTAGSPGTTTADGAEAAASAQATASVAAGLAVEAANSHAGIHHNANGTTTWTLRLGASTPDGRVAILEFLPRNIRAHRGDTVVWRPTDRNEPHTVTFPHELFSDIVPLCEGAGGVDTPAVPIVNPPMSPADFGCNGHPPDEIELGGGNGVNLLKSKTTVSDSGIVAYRTLGQALGAVGITRASWWVRFSPTAQLATYHYLCQIHVGMAATITVVK